MRAFLHVRVFNFPGSLSSTMVLSAPIKDIPPRRTINVHLNVKENLLVSIVQEASDPKNGIPVEGDWPICDYCSI